MLNAAAYITIRLCVHSFALLFFLSSFALAFLGFPKAEAKVPLPLSADVSSVNVMDFGAKGDGVTDDTVAIQRAMDAAFDKNGFSGGKTVYFPAGKYIIGGNGQNIRCTEKSGSIAFIGENAVLQSVYDRRGYDKPCVSIGGKMIASNIRLAASRHRGDMSVELSPFAHLDIQEGDLLIFKSSRNVEGDHRAGYFKEGITVPVTRIDTKGNRIILGKSLHEDMIVGNATYRPDSWDGTRSCVISELIGQDPRTVTYTCIVRHNGLFERHAITSFDPQTGTAYFQTSALSDGGYNGQWKFTPAAGDILEIERSVAVDVGRPLKIIWRGISVRRDPDVVLDNDDAGKSASFFGIRFFLAADLDASHFEVSGFSYCNMAISRCYHADVHSFKSCYANVFEGMADGLGYGFLIQGSTNCHIHDAYLSHCREHISTGGNSSQNVDNIFENIVINGGAPLSYKGEAAYPFGEKLLLAGSGFNTHGDSFHTVFRNIAVYDTYAGGGHKGKGTLIDSCSFNGDMQYAINCNNPHTDTVIKNCSFHPTNPERQTSFISYRIQKNYNYGYTIVENCFAENLNSTFLSIRDSAKDAVLKNLVLRNNLACFSGRTRQAELPGKKTGAKLLLTEGIMEGNAVFYSDASSAERMNFFSAGTGIEIPENGWMRVEHDMYLVHAGKNGVIRLPLGARTVVPVAVEIGAMDSDFSVFGKALLLPERIGLIDAGTEGVAFITSKDTLKTGKKNVQLSGNGDLIIHNASSDDVRLWVRAHGIIN